MYIDPKPPHKQRPVTEAVQRAEPAGVFTPHPDGSNAPAVKSAENGAENLNKINAHFSLKNGARSRSSVPLNLLGGHRWPGAGTPARRTKIGAAVDAEIGAGGPPLVSRDGVTVAIIPSRHRISPSRNFVAPRSAAKGKAAAGHGDGPDSRIAGE